MTTCSTPNCDATLGRRNLSGLCRPCLTRLNLCNPASQAKAKAGLREYFKDPAVREAQGERSRAQIAKHRATPDGAARLREISRPHLAKGNNPEFREKRIKAIRAAAYQGIPEHRWDECRVLTNKFGAAEARRIIIEDEATIERRRLAALTPFERQMDRVRSGAEVSEKVPMPSRVHSHTLGGVSDMGA